MRTHTYRDGNVVSVELLQPLPTWARLYSAAAAAGVLFGLAGLFVGLHLGAEDDGRFRERPGDLLRLVLLRQQEKGALDAARTREAFPAGEPGWATPDTPRIRADACTQDGTWITPSAMRRLAYVHAHVDDTEDAPPSSPSDADSPVRELLASAGLRLVSDPRDPRPAGRAPDWLAIPP